MAGWGLLPAGSYYKLDVKFPFLPRDRLTLAGGKAVTNEERSFGGAFQIALKKTFGGTL